MQIKELAEKTGLSEKTIRFYEEADVLPSPRRLPNGYRDYDQEDVERLQLVAGMRRLDFSLDDIREVLSMRDRREAPCRVMLSLLAEKAAEVSRRIAELNRLEGELRQLYALGLTFPTDDVEGKNCVCHLVSQNN